jgi:hypothetical protein
LLAGKVHQYGVGAGFGGGPIFGGHVSSIVVRERERVAAPLARPEAKRWWVPVLVFLAIAVVLWAVAALAAAHLGRTEQYSPAPAHFVGGALFEPWARWDASWYRTIVEQGYVYYPGVQSSVAFWPSYPLAMRLFEGVSPSPFVTGSLLTFVSGLACAVLFYAWCLARMSRRAATTSLLLLFLFPFAWYLYGAIYADAFCLAVILAAFLALERDRLWLAGVLGFVASAARPIGLIFAVALVLLLLERRNAPRLAELQAADDLVAERLANRAGPDGASLPPTPLGVRIAGRIVGGIRRLVRNVTTRFSPRGLSWSDSPVLLAFGGFIAWCGYLWIEFGDPFLWEHIQSVPGWDQGSGPTTWFKVFLFNQITHDASSPFTWSKLAQGVLAIGLLFTLPRIARRFGWAYAAFTAGVLLLPIVGTKDFMGTGRYLLVGFPVFALVGEWLAAKPRLRVAYLVASGALLVFLTSLFARGHYLA